MSTLVVKTVTGTLKYADGRVWPSGKIVFTPVTIFGATPVTVPIKEFSVYSGADGTFSIDLYTFDDAAVSYECLLPSGDEFTFNLPLGSGSTTLETLRQSSYTPPTTGYSHSGLTNLGADDHPHYLNTTRGDARYSLLAHNHSGVYSPVGHGHTASDISDFAATVRSTVLTGLGAGSNAAIAATDTVLGAFAKLQNQITNFAAGGMEIGGTITGSPTAGSVLFVGAGGVLAQENDGLFWDATNKRLKVGVAGVNANRQMIFSQFPGENIAAIYSGSQTPSSNNYAFAIGGGGVATYINFGPSGSLSIRNENVEVANCGGSSAFTFYAKDATRVPLAVQLVSSQTANAWEVLNNSNSIIARADAVGRLFAAPGGGSDTRIGFQGTTAGLGAWFGAGALTLNTADTPRMLINAAAYEFSTAASGHLCWYSGATIGAGSIDTGITRGGAGILKISNGSSGGGQLMLAETTAPAAPSTNEGIVFLEDNGSGKTRMMIRFATGAAQQLAIEP